jgi:hypothetical protein
LSVKKIEAPFIFQYLVAVAMPPLTPTSTEKMAETELQQPLLIVDAIALEAQIGDTNNKCDHGHILHNPTALWMIQIGTFLGGMLVAICSQLLLNSFLWNTVATYDVTWRVVGFSLLWSIFNSIVVVGTMLLIIQAIHHCTNASLLPKSDWDNVIFRVEAHHMMGALFANTISWIVTDLSRVSTVSNTDYVTFFSSSITFHQVMTVSLCLFVTVAAVFVWYRLHFHKSRKSDSPLLSTYQLLASILGFVIGLCSQFILNSLLSGDNLSHPIIENLVLFSFLWSTITVAIAFSGCYSLRFLVIEELTSSAEDAFEQVARIHVRMESCYVFASLLGICVSWLLFDYVLGLTGRILPSLAMLGIALVVFCFILHCFPEDECVEEYSHQMAAERQIVQACSISVVATCSEQLACLPSSDIYSQV